nr:MAG TPA: hypothetical protein [Caudoviricetes sp.]
MCDFISRHFCFQIGKHLFTSLISIFRDCSFSIIEFSRMSILFFDFSRIIF